ncbi:MAG: N-acetylmuramoyl-L-alanine amidase [Gammaproteobacteria bacterium]
MRVSATLLQRLLLGIALPVAICCQLVQASEIKGLRLDTGATGTRAELLLDAPAGYSLLSLSSPDRLVVDLPGVALSRAAVLPAGKGIVRAVRSGQPVPGTTRIVFDLAAPVAALAPRLEPAPEGARLVLEWPGDGDPLAAAGTRAAAAAAPAVSGVPATGDETARARAILAGLPDADAAAAQAGGADPAASSADATSRLIASLPALRTAPQPPGPARAALQPRPMAPAAAPADPPVAAAAAAPPPAAPARSLQDLRGPMRPLLIAIDAGHGGQDPGAIGLGGHREKDVNLAIARELARQVDATPGLKAYLVRDRDVFIPLHERSRMARRAGADMFISIHADGAENRNAKGSSVYVLSLKGASSQRARWLAEKENAADLIGGARLPAADHTLTSVLLDLTQSGNMKASEDAAAQVLAGLHRVGNVHKRQVERANFAVLRTSDMPAMLVETAFISNPEEERRLADPAFQRMIAGAVLDGVTGYFTRQPPPGTLFAARAAAAEGGASAGGSP